MAIAPLITVGARALSSTIGSATGPLASSTHLWRPGENSQRDMRPDDSAGCAEATDRHFANAR